MAKSLKLSKSENLKGKKLAKSKKPSKSGNLPNFDAKKASPSFLISEARSAFNCLWLTFTKAPILWHFNPKCHIWIETNVLGYAIDDVLSQLASGTSPNGVITKTDLGSWHPIAFFSKKMISAKTWYETHDGKLLAIIKVFKMWRHYLKGCKHEVLILTDNNNLRCFIDTKSLSFWQVRWAQKLCQYYFRINYHHGKANIAADALSRFPQKSQDEKNDLQAENGQILHWLQILLTIASLAGLSFSSRPSHLYQVFTYGT